MSKIKPDQGETRIVAGEPVRAGIDPVHGPFVVMPTGVAFVGFRSVEAKALELLIFSGDSQDESLSREFVGCVEWLLSIVLKFTYKELGNGSI